MQSCRLNTLSGSPRRGESLSSSQKGDYICPLTSFRLKGTSKNSISAYHFPSGETGMRLLKESIEFLEPTLSKRVFLTY